MEHCLPDLDCRKQGRCRRLTKEILEQYVDLQNEAKGIRKRIQKTENQLEHVNVALFLTLNTLKKLKNQ